MFSRLRYTVETLTHREDLSRRPDIAHSGEGVPEPTRFSKVIAGLIEVAILAAAAGGVGYLSHFFYGTLTTGQTETTLLGRVLTGVGGVFTLFAGGYYVHKLNRDLELRLKIAERIAPYFGHKLDETLQILRG